jgi:membrane-associated phospholipid phosphatase
VNDTFLVEVLSEYLVFAVLLIAVVGFLLWAFRRYQPCAGVKFILKDLLVQGIKIFVIPVGFATVISEIISSLCVRQRPFVTMKDVKLLVPHGADGGMPSHHMVFMMAIAVMVYLFNKKLSLLLFALSVISGIARISAGIHYPSDVLAGALLGGVLDITYARIMLKSGNNH